MVTYVVSRFIAPKMSKLLFVLLLSLVVVGYAATDYSTLDKILFEPFCSRSTVQSILGICLNCPACPPNDCPPAADNDITFGSKTYSIAGSGNIKWLAGTSGYSSFMVATTGPTTITCLIQTQSSLNTKKNFVQLYSVAPEANGFYELPNNPTQGDNGDKIYQVTGEFARGAAIVVKDVPFEFSCIWSPSIA